MIESSRMSPEKPSHSQNSTSLEKAQKKAPLAQSTIAEPFISEYDQHLFNEGSHDRIYQKLGAQCCTQGGTQGVHFAVWAPNARAVSVIGDFNYWDRQSHALLPLNNTGIWTLFIPTLKQGELYKYAIEGADGTSYEKVDPYGFASEIRPKTASRILDLNNNYTWHDESWVQQREQSQWLQKPVSIYEVHLGSWLRVPEEDNRWLTYRELADKLVPYVKDLGFTHVEFLPVAEHPLDASWGYQVTGYFAPTSRFGTPEDFMALVDQLHQHNIGIILDWVPGHFPKDAHGLAFFDGTHLYEHADPRMREHKDWGTYIFNYGRHEVSNFLISNAMFWMDKYHIDGLRVDAVASMLYLDYSRPAGEWLPNRHGGNDNIEAIEFMRRLNERIHLQYPGTLIIAEESTAWPQVSHPTFTGGLGYDFKWDMGWMNDSLRYMGRPTIYRKYHHNELTFRRIYAFSENFLLPLSHDEVVHGKQSLLSKMPGDSWQKFANLRLLFGYQYTQPGKKLLFMGAELATWNEWQVDQSLDWPLLNFETHQGIQRWVRDLNNTYRCESALHDLDCDPSGFAWIDCNNTEESILIYLRQSQSGEKILVAMNFTEMPREGYTVHVPAQGLWQEILNSDATCYGGNGLGNLGGVTASANSIHEQPSLQITLPSLGMVILKHMG